MDRLALIGGVTMGCLAGYFAGRQAARRAQKRRRKNQRRDAQRIGKAMTAITVADGAVEANHRLGPLIALHREDRISDEELYAALHAQPVRSERRDAVPA